MFQRLGLRITDCYMIATQDRVADFRMTHAVVGSQARLVDTWINHVFTILRATVVGFHMTNKMVGSQANVMDVPTTHALVALQRCVVDIWRLISGLS